MRKMNIIFLLLLMASSCTAKYEALEGHQVWKVSRCTTLLSMQHDGLVDIIERHDGYMMVHIYPKHLQQVKKALDEKNINFSVAQKCVAEHLRYLDSVSNSLSRNGEVCTSGNCDKPFYFSYMKYDQITWYLEAISSKHDFVSLETIGKSYEKREMKMIHISARNKDKNVKKIWIQAGSNARVWTTASVALIIIDKITTSPKMRENVEWFIIPASNPDGYAYTEENPYWIKNKRIVIQELEPCNGVNLDRNWGYQWGLNEQSTSQPCSGDYCGHSGFSEPETLSLSNKMRKIPNLSMAIFFQPYGPAFVFPWGYSYFPDKNHDDMMQMGEAFAEAAEKHHGTHYTVGQTARNLQRISGGPEDWVRGILGVKYTQTIRFPGYSFLIGEHHIKPTAGETWDGIQAMVNKMTADQTR